MKDNGVGGGGGVKADDVISKLKDDGDFDRLRLKIVRQLKENEELRSNITAMVKQSSSLARQDVEKMKPRQLSDAIHEEIGDKLMNQISDGLWNIIRSTDGGGMKVEITETVQSVYCKLSNPKGNLNGESSSCMNFLPSNGNPAASSIGFDGTLSDAELKKPPPGFGLHTLCQRNKNILVNQPNGEMGNRKFHKRKAIAEIKKELADDFDVGAPPGFSSVLECKKPTVAGDEDLDVPPGFG